MALSRNTNIEGDEREVRFTIRTFTESYCGFSCQYLKVLRTKAGKPFICTLFDTVLKYGSYGYYRCKQCRRMHKRRK
jgi:hypothetical protein